MSGFQGLGCVVGQDAGCYAPADVVQYCNLPGIGLTACPGQDLGLMQCHRMLDDENARLHASGQAPVTRDCSSASSFAPFVPGQPSGGPGQPSPYVPVVPTPATPAPVTRVPSSTPVVSSPAPSTSSSTSSSAASSAANTGFSLSVPDLSTFPLWEILAVLAGGVLLFEGLKN